MLLSAGIYKSVEGFYMLKLLLCVIGTAFLIGIQTTNLDCGIKDIKNNPNYAKAATDKYIDVDDGTKKTEENTYAMVEKQIRESSIGKNTLLDENNKNMLVEYIANYISGEKLDVREDAGKIAERMYKKLVNIYRLKNDFAGIVYIFLFAVFLFNLPDIMVRLKIRLIEDKKDWEVLNCTYVYTIFGRLPPYNIRPVLSNMLVVAEVFKPLIAELLENLKDGKGEKSFDEILSKTDNQELYEMFETMKLSINTGLINTVDLIDESAANQLKWLEIKSIKRRKTKQLFAMIPVVIVMLLAAVYFSYSLTILINPANFVK